MTFGDCRLYKKCDTRVRLGPLWVISGHTDKSAPCPLYPQQRTLDGTSKSAFGIGL